MMDGLYCDEESCIEAAVRRLWWRVLRAFGFQQVGPLGVGPWRRVGRNQARAAVLWFFSYLLLVVIDILRGALNLLALACFVAAGVFLVLCAAAVIACCVLYLFAEGIVSQVRDEIIETTGRAAK